MTPGKTAASLKASNWSEHFGLGRRCSHGATGRNLAQSRSVDSHRGAPTIALARPPMQETRLRGPEPHTSRKAHDTDPLLRRAER
jgi:hypothetical protein